MKLISTVFPKGMPSANGLTLIHSHLELLINYLMKIISLDLKVTLQ